MSAIAEILLPTPLAPVRSVFDANDSFDFQVGANQGETITMAATSLGGDVTAGGLSNLTDMGVSTAAQVATALCSGGTVSDLSSFDKMIENVSKVRGTYGAVQNRLEHRLANLATYQENLTASESRIRDVDMAAEMTKFTKLNILQQAGTSMLAQANQAPQNILSLLRQ